jgi:2-polyprenyl-3-methyl-5-hydroxy-6-metoxy-1,4-benzoquinol methylase
VCPACGATGVPVYEGLEDRLFGVPGHWCMKRCTDPRCGAYWLDPMPLEADLAKLYLRYYTHHDRPSAPPRLRLRGLLSRHAVRAYLHSNYGYESGQSPALRQLLTALVYLNPAWRADLDFSVFHLSGLLPGKLLEVGCGGGGMLQAMAARGWQVAGLDFDEQAVRNARAKGFTVHYGDLLEQRFPAASFDAIAMSHVIEHVPDPRGMLRECLRLLRSGGQLVMVTPNIEGRLHRLYGADWRGLEPPRHLTLFSPRAIERLAREVGFDDVTVRTSVRDSGNLRLASMAIKKRANFEMDRRAGWRDRLSAKAVGVLLGYAHLLDSKSGDELVAICRKR